MAFVVFQNGQHMIVSPKVGEMIWAVKDGLQKPENDAQARFVARVRRVYLNRDAAPQVYLENYRIDHKPVQTYFRLPYKD